MATLDTNKLLIDISSDQKLSDLIKSKEGLDGFIKETKKSKKVLLALKKQLPNRCCFCVSDRKIIGPIDTNQGYAILQIHSKSEFDSTAFAAQKDQIQKLIF